MSERRQALFLERQVYRRHRLVDAIKTLPFVGLLLWLLPLLWAREPGDAVGTADALVYVFVVWFVLIALSAIVAVLLARDADNTSDRDRSSKAP
jgi:ABC-type methionine transport system permease subunit